MASLAGAAPAKKKTKRPGIPEGTIFYIKWDMKPSGYKYYKAFATGKNYKNGNFDVRYAEDGTMAKPKPNRKNINDESRYLLSEQEYLNTVSKYPPKKVPIGEEHQAVVTAFGEPSSVRGMVQVDTTTDNLKVPMKNKEAEDDMERQGLSEEGWLKDGGGNKNLGVETVDYFKDFAAYDIGANVLEALAILGGGKKKKKTRKKRGGMTKQEIHDEIMKIVQNFDVLEAIYRDQTQPIEKREEARKKSKEENGKIS